MRSLTKSYEVIAIAIGGGAGAVLRYYLAIFVQSSLRADFPYGILVVNSLGCFFIGLLAAILLGASVWDNILRAGLLIGLLGGFTTFSSFSLDNFKLLQQGSYVSALFNILISVFAGLFLSALGWWLGKIIWPR
jgi:fluoride exporter